MKNVVLFGCGKIGGMALDLFKKDSIAFFVDNSIAKGQEKFFQDIKVISFVDYKEIQKDYITVLTVNSKYELQIAEQLKKNDILSFCLWEEIIGLFNMDKQMDAVTIREKIGRKDDKYSELLHSVKEMIYLKKDEDSQVEFYLVDAFEINHFLPVYRALLKEGIHARIVAEPQAINSAESWFDYHHAKDQLNTLGIEYSTLRNPDAQMAFTTQFARNLKYYSGLKCQMSYGAVLKKDKAFQLKREVAKQFDYLFVNGNLYKEIAKKYLSEEQIVDMSYPRYLKNDECEVSRAEIMNELGIYTDKPIVVYYPTWDEYSSIQKYENALKTLKKKFYLIAKPHHCIWRDEKNIESLYRSCDLVLDGQFSLYKTTKITDCAVCDAKSGVVTELAFLKPEIHMLVIYYNCSNKDFYIDLNKFVMGVQSPSELDAALKKIINDDEKIDSRKKLIYKMYSPDIQGGITRVIETIHKVLEG